MLASDFKFCFGCICLSHVCFIHQSPQVVSCSSKPVVALVMQPIILQHTVVLLLPNIAASQILARIVLFGRFSKFVVKV